MEPNGARWSPIVSAPIFISYSSKDQDIAETIYRALEARGHDCWIACRDVQPGENYQEAIVRALRAAKVMLLVFTSNANNSDEIKKELVLAGRHRVTVVPVRVEDVAPNDAFTYELATRQWIDLFKDWERQISILAARLGSILQSDQPGGAKGRADVGIAAGGDPHRDRQRRALSARPVAIAGAGVTGRGAHRANRAGGAIASNQDRGTDTAVLAVRAACRGSAGCRSR